MSSLQKNPRSHRNFFDSFDEDEAVIGDSLQWVCSIAGQLGDAFMVFARWQCLGLGGRIWKKTTDGKLFDPGEDEWLTFFHEDDQGPVALGLADPAVNSFPDVRILLPEEGSYQLASMRMFFPPFETDGNIFAIVFNLRESSKKPITEVASTHQVDHLLASSTAEVVELDRSTGVVSSCSLSFEEANDLSENELDGVSWLDLGLMEQAYAEMMLEKIKLHSEFKNYPAVMHSRKGHYREMLIDVLPSFNDGKVVLTFQDVTSQNCACRHLHEVIDHMPYGVFTRAIDSGRYQLSNTKANQLLNSGSPLRGLEDTDFFSENDVAAILSSLTLDLETGSLNSSEPIQLEDSEMEIQFIPMRNRSGKVSRVIGVINESNQQVTEDSEGLSLSKTHLLNVGHEIRTPMNAILGFTSLLSETALQSEQQEMLETVRASGKALSHTVDLMLELATLSGSKQSVETSATDIEAVLEDLGEAYYRKAQEAGLALSVEIDPQMPTQLEADAPKISQLMTNLVENAIKFTPAGEVGIQADLLDINMGTATILLSVFDTGIGIPEEKQKLIFEAFQQVESADNRSYEGTGLGLTVSDRIARVMGSRIELQSRLGEGSIFSLQLRLKVSEAADTIAMTTAFPSALKLAIFAPEKASGTALSRLFSLWGANVSLTTDQDEFHATLANADQSTLGLCLWTGCNNSLSESKSMQIVNEAKAGRVMILTSNELDASILSEECGSERVIPSLVRGSLIRNCIKEFVTSLDHFSAPKPSSVDKTAHIFRGMKALVVDDRSDARRDMLSLMTDWGVEVDLCESERAATELVNAKTYDVVLFEANYLGRDTAAMIVGLQLYFDDVDSTTFVALTHTRLDTAQENLQAAKVDYFLTKPVDAGELKTVLKNRI